MPDQSRSTLAVLRCIWFVLLVLLALLVWLPAGYTWTVPSAVLWLAGAWLLSRPQRRVALADTWNEAAAGTAPRMALVVLAGVFVLAIPVLGALAAVVLLLALGVVLLVLAAAGTPRAVRETLSGLAVLSVTLVIALAVGELVFRSPALARRFGAPEELRAWKVRYDRLWTQNLLGLRSPYDRIAKAAGVRRILAIGDSFTWGDKIAETDSTWPARLERALRAQQSDSLIQVINMGQRGYTTANEAEQLRRMGWQFDPDLVVVQFLPNDALPSYPNMGHEGTEWLVPQHSLLPWRVASHLATSSALYAFINQQYNRLRSRRPYYEAFPRTFEPDFIGWKQLSAGLREMGDSARARHVPIVLVIFPFFIPGEWDSSTYPAQAIDEKVAREAEADGFHVLDLIPVFAEKGGDWKRWWATPYDGHPSAAAHAVAADAVLRYLEHERLLGPRGGGQLACAATVQRPCGARTTTRAGGVSHAARRQRAHGA